MKNQASLKQPVKFEKPFKTIDWSDDNIKKKIKEEIKKLTHQINTNTTGSFRKIRATFKYLWCTKDNRIIPIQEMNNDHLKSSLILLFKDIRGLALDVNKHALCINKPGAKDYMKPSKWWYKESQFYTWSVLREFYPVVNTMIVEAKQRNIWDQIVMEMETNFPQIELDLLSKRMANKITISEPNKYLMLNVNKNNISLQWSTER